MQKFELFFHFNSDHPLLSVWAIGESTMNNPTLKSMNFPLKLVSMLPKSSESEINVNQLDNLFSRITFFNFFSVVWVFSYFYVVSLPIFSAYWGTPVSVTPNTTQFSRGLLSSSVDSFAPSQRGDNCSSFFRLVALLRRGLPWLLKCGNIYYEMLIFASL